MSILRGNYHRSPHRRCNESGGKGRATGMLDALVHGKDGQISRSSQTTMVEELLKGTQNLGIAVGVEPDALQEVRAG